MASNVTMTDVRNGIMFLEMILVIGVPRHLDASEYSRSLMIMVWVLKKYAIPSQPVIVRANTNGQNPEVMM